MAGRRCTLAGRCPRKTPRQNAASQQLKENSMDKLPEMVELSGAELDAVTGGQANGNSFAAGGLVNLALGPTNVDVLRQANIDVIDDVTVTLRDIAHHNN